MNITDLPIDQLKEARWNPNVMNEAMLMRLRESISRFGLVSNLVVRTLGDDTYEVLSGNQRLQVLKDSNVQTAPCVVLDLDDSHARLLAQGLNRIEGTDDFGLKAELVREVLNSIPQSEVMSLLPDSSESLTALVSLGEADMAQHLQAWDQAQAARLRHLTFQLVPSQLEVIEEAIELATVGTTGEGSNPNKRGNALYALCRQYLAGSQTNE